MKRHLNIYILRFTVLLLVLLIGGVALGQTMIKYDLTSVWTSTTTTPASINTGTFSTDATSPTISGNFANASGWNNVGLRNWISTPISTVGYYNVNVAFYVKSDATTGPRDFVLQYTTSSGGTWINAGTYTLSTASTQKSITLPSGASNQATLYIRWHQSTLKSLNNGNISSLSKSYINGVNITAPSLLYSVVQSSDIRIVARTSTSIEISWTKGGTNPQLLMMNTTNDFNPLPVNDETFTVMSGTYTSGRQVIFNTIDVNAPATFTVNVPSATDTYWFRVFDYQYNGGMERYATTETGTPTDYPPGNPKQCYLEQITLNDASFKLVTANISATIAPKRGVILERGIIYSLLQNFNIGDSYTLGSDDLDQDGTFNFEDYLLNIADYSLLRGQTVYYKAYVTNESGKIYSDEKSFDNTPIFSGTGDWEDETKWNVSEVPGSSGTIDHASIEDSPIIDGDCTLNDTTRCTILTINPTAKLTIQPEKSLTVVGDLINDAGTSGLVIKASSTAANGSLIYPQGLTVPATVEMYSKASWNASLSNLDNSKYKWQFFGIPVTELTANPTFYGAYVRRWDEAGTEIYNHWVLLTNSDVLTPFTGYEICQLEPKTYSFSGNLVTDDYSNISLPFTPSALYPGQQILANPYTAAINIAKLLTVDNLGSDVEPSVYLYNAGTFDDWSNHSGQTTNDSTTTTPGQYTVSTSGASGTAGVPSQIPSMQAFLVKSMVEGGNNWINIPYSSVTTSNTEQQRVHANSISNQKVAMRIDVRGTHFSDKMWVFTDSTCTRKYDRAWDGRKLFGSARTPQLFAIEADGNYQIDAVADMNNTDLGFQAGEEKEFTMKFTHENTEHRYKTIYLFDLVAKTSTDITVSGTEYKFTAVPNTPATKRFKIITQNLDEAAVEDSKVKLYSIDGMLFVQNISAESGVVKLFDISGRFVQQLTFGANKTTTLFKPVSPGVYLATILSNGKETSKRIIVR